MRKEAQRRAAALSVGMLAVLLVAGCGGGGMSSTVAGHRPPPPKPKRPARPCGPDQLVVSHAGGANAFMSGYHTSFDIFNLTDGACSIGGYPKLFAVRRGGGATEGPARHGTGAHEASEGPLNIVGRGSAAFQVSWSEDVGAAESCGPRIVQGYRVTLPGSDLVQAVPYPNFEHCMGKGGGEGSLKVGRIEPSGGRSPSPQPRLKEAKPAEHLPRCDPSDLVVWQGHNYPGGAAAGTSYGHLEVTNLGPRPCKLSGVPHMVAVDLRGRTIGPPVGRSPSMPTISGGPPIRVARLGPHRSAYFTFAVGEVLNYGTHGCEYKYAAGFDVTLPGTSHPQYVPAPVRRCLHSVAPNGPQVSVGPIE
jgi:hypothetical protein